MTGGFGRARIGIILGTVTAFSLVWLLTACDAAPDDAHKAASKAQSVLEFMSVTWGPHLAFEKNFLRAFGNHNSIETQFLPNIRLSVYQDLLRAHAGAPDLLEIDVVWPAILADDLVDLRPYIKDEKAFPPRLLENYTVHGRLVALPAYVDLGILYYRTDLLQKYGFAHPPATWDELAAMAARIQAGERRSGNKDFWGYVWQGSATEGGACNALEWQSSAGAGNFIEPSGRIHVRSPLFFRALRRATDWIGVISPAAEFVYREDDSVNLWTAGQTAFMRNWASGYNLMAGQAAQTSRPFAVAPMPAGPAGRRGTLGGAGIAVSKYAAHRELAIRALLELTGESNDLARLAVAGGIPAHVDIMQRPEQKSRSQLLQIAPALVESLVARPALVSGDKYEAVSLEYAKAVNSVLRRRATPEAAMAELEKTLVRITGLPIQPN